MTDIKLLSLAAKAAGVEHPLDMGVHWDPLDNDGDAFRLAADLEIEILPCEDRCRAWRSGFDPVGEWYEGDRYASIRRAIVRAAAEIGREMG